jgi:hypothetical protein
MSKSIPDELVALSLGEGAVIRGVRVVRRSLFGFQLGAGNDLLDAAQAAARIAGATRRAVPRTGVQVCFRCAGDGLGRRDRGVCGVCHGRGIQVAEPPAGWEGASPAQVAAAAAQASAALGAVRHARARQSLAALLATLSPRAA